MDEDLKIVIASQLEADEEGSAQRIAAQLPNIAKLINAKSSIKVGIELDERGVQSQVQGISKQIGQITRGRNIVMNVDIGTDKVNEMVQRLRDLKVPDSAIKTFRKNIEDTKMSVTDIVTSFDAMQQSVTAVITGVNKAGDVIRQTQGVKLISDENGEIIAELSKDVVVYEQHIEKLAQAEAKRAEKEKKDNDARIAFLEKQKQALVDIQANYTGFTSTKPIMETEHLTTLTEKYNAVENEITKLMSTTGKLGKTQQTTVQNMIAELKRLATGYQNVEYVATKLRTKTVKEVKNDELQKLTEYEAKLESTGLLTDDFKSKIGALRTQLDNAFDKTSLVAYLDAFDRLDGEVGSLKAKLATDSKANGYADSMDYIGSKIDLVEAKFQALSQQPEELGARVANLRELFAQFNDTADNSEKIRIFEELQRQLSLCDGQINNINKQGRLSLIDPNLDTNLQKARSDLETIGRQWSALKYDKGLNQQFDILRSGLNEIKDPIALKNWRTEFNAFKSEVKAAGKNVMSLGDILKNNLSKVLQWVSATTMLFRAIRLLKSACKTIIELDTAMVDLRKVTGETEASYRKFYYTANETAKSLGVTTQALIAQTAEWARLGYTLKDAEKMAENSAIFTAISPELNMEESTDGLISIMKAFGYEADYMLDGVISKINKIGNEMAVSNKDLVEVMTRSSAAMSAANNSFEETIALATAATEITRDASSVGNALKTVSMRIRAIDEETEEFSSDLTEITGKVADLTKVASNGNKGISLFEPGDPNTYRSTYDILKDISKIWKELTDKNRADLLEVLFGKRQGQVGSAILSNFVSAEKAIEKMADANGNAMKEMEKVYDSLEYKLNQLKETWVGVSQNLVDDRALKVAVDGLTALSNIVDFLTEHLGLLGTVGIVAAVGYLTKFRSAINGVQTTIDPVVKTLNGMTFDKSIGSLLDYASVLSSLDPIQQKLAMSLAGLNAEQQEQILTIMSAVAATREYNVATLEQTLNMKAGTLVKILNVSATDKVTIETLKAAVANKKLLDEQFKQILMTQWQVAANNQASGSFAGLSTSLTSAGQAAGVAWKSLGIFSKIGLIVSVATTVIGVIGSISTAIKNHIEQSKKKIKELEDQYKNLQSTISNIANTFRNLQKSSEDIIPKFTQLAKGVDKFGKNVSLTDEEYAEFLELNNRIAEMFPEINLGMDSNGNAMLALSYGADTLTDSLLALVEAERAAANAEIAKTMPDILENIQETDKEYEKQISSLRKIQKEYKDVFDDIINQSLPTSVGRFSTLEAGSAAVEKFISKAQELGMHGDVLVDDNWTTNNGYVFSVKWNYDMLDVDYIESQYKIALERYEKQINDFETRMQAKWGQLNPVVNSWLQTDFMFQDLNDQMQEIAKTMVSGLDFSQLGLTTQDDIQAYIDDNIVEPLFLAAPTVKEAFAQIIDWKEQLASGKISQEDFTKYVKDAFNGIFVSMNPDAIDNFKQIFVNAFNDMGIAGSNFDVVLDSLISEWANGLPTLTDGLNQLTYDVERFYKQSGTIKDGIASIKKAFDELNEDGDVSYSALTDIREKFADIPGIDEFISKLAKAKGNTEAVTQAMSDMIYALVQSKYATADLAEADENVVATMLDEAGVANSVEYAHYIITEAKIKNKAASYDLINATNDTLAPLLDEIKLLLGEGDAAQYAEQYLSALRMEKILSNDTTLDETDSVEQLIEIAAGAGASAESLREYIRLKKLVDKGTVAGFHAIEDGSYENAKFNAVNEANRIIAEIKGSLKNAFTGGSYFDFKPTDSKKTKKEVEEYLATIDRFREAQEQLRRAEEKREKIESNLENSGSLEERIRLRKELIQAYKDEQAALHNLNEQRDAAIKEDVSKLTQRGFEIEYDPDNNQFWVKNLERINSLTAKSKGKYDTLQEATNAYRKETEELIKTLEEWNEKNRDGSNQWVEDELAKIAKIIEGYEDITKAYENEIAIRDKWVSDAAEKKDTAALEKSTREIVDYYKQMQQNIHEEANYYRSLGYSEDSDEVTALKTLWWDYAESIKDAKNNVIDYLTGLVEASNDAVDEIQGVYDTFHKAADEYAQSGGYITVDTFQEILALGPQYLQLLTDENGALVMEEEAIQKIIAARVEQLALENAMTYVERLRLAANGDSLESLNDLLYVTEENTDATWGFVKAKLALMKAKGELNTEQYEAALHNIEAMRVGAVNAIEGITKSVEGAGDLMKYVMDMMKSHIEQEIEEIERMKDEFAELIDLRKKALDAAKDEADYQKDIAAKTKEMAKLQARIDALSLDDSREAQAERAKLLEEMNGLQEDLNEKQADHAIDQQKEALDKMQKDYEETQDARIKDLEDSISSEQKLYDMAVNHIKSNWGSLLDELTNWNYQFGSDLTVEIESAWDKAIQAAQNYFSYVSGNDVTGKDYVKYYESTNQGGSGSTGSGGGNKNYTVADTKKTQDYSDLDMVHAIVARMKEYAAAWKPGDPTGEHSKAADEAARLPQYGVQAEFKNGSGVWEIKEDKFNPKNKGKNLYSVYHTGGIVGGGEIKANEKFALLKDKEWVLSEEMVDNLSKQMERINVLSEAFHELPQYERSAVLPELIKAGGSSTVNNVTNNSRPVEIHIGDTVIHGRADAGTVAAHQKISREQVNEIARMIGVRL